MAPVRHSSFSPFLRSREVLQIQPLLHFFQPSPPLQRGAPVPYLGASLLGIHQPLCSCRHPCLRPVAFIHCSPFRPLLPLGSGPIQLFSQQQSSPSIGVVVLRFLLLFWGLIFQALCGFLLLFSHLGCTRWSFYLMLFALTKPGFSPTSSTVKSKITNNKEITGSQHQERSIALLHLSRLFRFIHIYIYNAAESTRSAV